MFVSPAISRPTLPAGMPCWVEVATHDETAAQRFYGGLFGWGYQRNRDPATRSGRYLISSLNGVATGGLYQTRPGQSAEWTLHLAVNSTASMAEWVGRLGGKVTLGPTEIPHRGSILHVIDPTGAPIVFWRTAPSWEFASGRPNTFRGADLNTHDGPAADQFYGRLFRYGMHQVGDAHSVDYMEWRLNQEAVLYRYVMGPEYPRNTPPHWMVYFAVDAARGTDGVAGHALMLGGKLIIEPYGTPWGRIAVLADPSGAVFSVVDPTDVAEAWGQAAIDDDAEE